MNAKVFIPIDVYILDKNNPFQSSKALSLVQEYNNVNKAKNFDRIHSLVIHPSVMIERQPPADQKSKFIYHLLTFLEDEDPASHQYVLDILQEPEWWPLAYSELFEHGSKEIFYRFGKVIAPIMDRAFASYSIADFISKILTYAFSTQYSFWISMQMICTAIQKRFHESAAVTILWDEQRVRVLFGVEHGGRIAETYPLAWDYLEEIWPTETSKLVSFIRLFRGHQVDHIAHDELRRFATEKWKRLSQDNDWIEQVPRFTFLAQNTTLTKFGITKIEVLGQSRVMLLDTNNNGPQSFLIYKVSTPGEHCTAFVQPPDFWEDDDPIVPLLVETFMLCLILDILEKKMSLTEEGIVIPANNITTDNHIQEFFEKFDLVTQTNGARC